MLKAKNIIFDLGGVVLDIDYKLTLNEFNRLGININDYSILTGKNEIFNQFDCGLVSPSEFRKQICGLFNISVDAETFDLAWNKLLLEWDFERLKFIERLRDDYKIFLLSNTNAIHFEHYNKELAKKTGKELKDYFDKLYLSFELGMRKPQPEIFQRVLDENRIDPKETLFIDDTLEHIAAAKKLGINAIHLNGGNIVNPLKDTLTKILN
ncbi:MAG: glucose-phosphatase [Tenuifilum sp.]|uniref:HAD family hydrolase n=1 Tax=Tenuifilum sp. TaxID=2760880 RepID=UPI0024AA7E06|nr:HAD family phosphatase [Tenuifilum sp.]MDI3527421.1 glucose-phosphatase [Tenuifilum sp.]